MSEERLGDAPEIDFVYEYDPGYKIVAANGVWGGTTPRGDFRLDFFVESQAIPKKITHALQDKKLGKELSREPPERFVVRRMQVGILLSQRDLKSIVDFLNERLKLDEKVTEEK